MTIGKIILWTILVVIFLLVILVLYFRLKVQNERKKQLTYFIDLFTNNCSSMPTLEFGSSYGWPTFTVTFASKADYEVARTKKLLDKFKSEIASFYGAEFLADSAIVYKY